MFAFALNKVSEMNKVDNVLSDVTVDDFQIISPDFVLKNVPSTLHLTLTPSLTNVLNIALSSIIHTSKIEPVFVNAQVKGFTDKSQHHHVWQNATTNKIHMQTIKLGSVWKDVRQIVGLTRRFEYV